VQHLAVEQRQDAGEHVRAEPLQIDNALARERVEDALAQRIRVRVVAALEAELDVGPGVAGQLAARHQALLVGRAPEVERAGPLDQGLVEVEEGSAGHAPETRHDRRRAVWLP
jgi:hypothetical protein